MHVVILGASGFIGRELCKALSDKGYDVFAVSRNPDSAKRVLGDSVRALAFDEDGASGWKSRVDGAFALINLAGENIGAGRWSAERKKRILDSRLEATRAVVDAIEKADRPPAVLIQASAIGYYGHLGDVVEDERAANGEGFLASVCHRWEKEAEPVVKMGVRLVFLRSGVVLGNQGGALPKMVEPIKSYLGGRLGSGKQWLSWIHISDMLRAIGFLLENEELHGPFNITAPSPVTNREITKIIAKRLSRPALMWVPGTILKLTFGKDFADEMLLCGRKVLPGGLSKAGFEFEFADAASAVNDLFSTSPLGHP